MPNRKGPEDHASETRPGTIQLGNDGNIWIVSRVSNGSQRWKPYLYMQKKNVTKSQCEHNLNVMLRDITVEITPGKVRRSHIPQFKPYIINEASNRDDWIFHVPVAMTPSSGIIAFCFMHQAKSPGTPCFKWNAGQIPGRIIDYGRFLTEVNKMTNQPVDSKLIKTWGKPLHLSSIIKKKGNLYLIAVTNL